MIDHVLNHDFVCRSAKAVLKEFTSPADDRRGPQDPLSRFSQQELEASAKMLSEALEKEGGRGSFHGNFDRADEARQGERPLSNLAFISHEPAISIFQSALEKRLREIPGAVREDLKENDRRGGQEIPAVTGSRLQGAPGDRGDDRRILGAFSETDPRWVACYFAEALKRLSKGTAAFPERPATPCDIASDARILLVGDWGSGLPRATELASNIMKAWLKEAEGRERHVIHLGDIYYSGWESEADERFLKHWPVEKSESDKIKSWALNGNHEMFCGGHGYFNTVLRDTRFARQENSNRFTLRHPNWEILGADSAYEDDSLTRGQAAWVRESLSEAKNQSKRKGMLLTHHQLFSAYESDSKNLGRELKEALDESLIRCWFWGHEHRFVAYNPHMGVQFARCIGHGGVPVYQWRGEADPVKAPAAYELRSVFTTTGGLERWALFGFAVFDFKANGEIHAYYVNERGQTHFGDQRDTAGRSYEVIS